MQERADMTRGSGDLGAGELTKPGVGSGQSLTQDMSYTGLALQLNTGGTWK